MENEFTTKLKSVLKGRVAVYIDAANLEQSVKDMWVNPKDVPDEVRGMTTDLLKWAIDYQRLKSFFNSISNCENIYFYSADFKTKTHFSFLYFLNKELGFKLNTKPLKEYVDHTPEIPHRKANFDVEIAVDAVSMIDSFDTLILFSGDCDFEYLVKFLRGKNKIVVGFSRSGHVAKELPPTLSRYFDIADFRSEFLKVKSRNAKNPAPFGTGSRR